METKPTKTFAALLEVVSSSSRNIEGSLNEATEAFTYIQDFQPHPDTLIDDQLLQLLKSCLKALTKANQQTSLLVDTLKDLISQRPKP